jgi:predicted ATPase/DNA-binding SARP family transcriptional activator
MQISTLGPLAVDGRPVRGERLAAVVRELVDARGRAVSVSSLVEVVWDGAPPEDASGAVQALVSRVRRLGLPVVAVRGGYRVPADEVRVDAVEARSLVQRARAALHAGDAAGARRCADEARALFPEVPELAGGDGVRLLADVADLRARAAFAGEGAFDEADLRRLAAHTPPDEPSAALLVRVLAAQGRNAEALAVVAGLRADLAQRYGTDPSPVVERAHLALLRGELSADASAATPVPQPTVPQRRVVLPAAWLRPATALVGRDADVAAVTSALSAAPLVTVVATGGAGKTRLAAEIARRAAAEGRGVRVVELAGVRSPEEVLPAVLAAIGADTTVGRPDLGQDRRTPGSDERLRAAARDLDGLVVLDNCEHVLDAAATVVADLLAVAPPDVAVLATSRAPLSLVGEVVHRLPALPDDVAVGLLADRVRAGGATLTRDAEQTLRLCHRLDNLPLALELAGARLRHMPIEDVLAGLSDRFALLDDALRGLPERHASLWALVGWSHELLAPAERELLQRLAVVPAPFTAEAAALVAGTPTVRAGLATLVEQSLLSLVRADGGPPRYRMLETVREYGVARLDAVDGRDAAMAGLVQWARARAVELFAGLVGPGQLAAIAGCAEEQDNLTVALRWAVEHGDEAASVDIAVALFHLWTVRGLHVEVSDWAHTLLHVADPAVRSRSTIVHGTEGDGPLPHADRLAWLCIVLALNSAVTNAYRAFALARRSLRSLLAQRPADVSPRSTALVATVPLFGSADPDDCLAVAAELVAHPDPYVQAVGLFVRAGALETQGQLTVSAQHAELAYERFESIGDHWGMGMAAQGVGEWFSLRGRAEAGDWLRRGERHMELVGAVHDVGSIRVMLDVQLANSGDEDAALRLTEAATSPEVRGGDTAQAHLGLAQLAWQQQRYDDALRHADVVIELVDGWTVALALQARVSLQVAVAVLYLRIAVAMPTSGARDRETRAITLLTQARSGALSSSDMLTLGSWALGGAALAAHLGDVEGARELWALGVRLSAGVANLFQHGYGERLTAALGTGDGRESLLATWADLTVGERTGRVRELMDELLG